MLVDSSSLSLLLLSSAILSVTCPVVNGDCSAAEVGLDVCVICGSDCSLTVLCLEVVCVFNGDRSGAGVAIDGCVISNGGVSSNGGVKGSLGIFSLEVVLDEGDIVTVRVESVLDPMFFLTSGVFISNVVVTGVSVSCVFVGEVFCVVVGGVAIVVGGVVVDDVSVSGVVICEFNNGIIFSAFNVPSLDVENSNSPSML